MKEAPSPSCTRTAWRGREARLLGNGVVRLVTLLGGGHIAEFRFEGASGEPSVNPLWVPPWPTMEPDRYRPAQHDRIYGSLNEGKLLSGVAGHSLCMDYFGPPSEEEAAQGLSQHGEAPSSRWKVTARRVSRRGAALTLAVQLPAAGLQFSRKIELRPRQSVAYFEETVRNERKADHFFQWTQHVSLGPAFLARQDSETVLPGTKGMAYPHAYNENKDLLVPGRTFQWPKGPRQGGGVVDLTRPWIESGRGLVAGILIDPRRQFGFVAAVNRRLGLLIAYCFRREDFPWVTLWEENRAIAGLPWKRHTQARGLEFTTTPLPLLRRETFNGGPLFGHPTLACVPARAERTVRYAALLAQVPSGFEGPRNIEVKPGQVIIRGTHGKDDVIVPASGVEKFLGC